MRTRFWASFLGLVVLSSVVVSHSQLLAQDDKSIPRELRGVEAVVLRLDHRGEIWTIRSEKDGVTIEVKTKSGERAVQPEGLQKIGRVQRVSATKLEYEIEAGSFQTYVGLAIESETRDGKQLEYRMALWRGYHELRDWSVSAPLAVRFVNAPFHTVGIGLPGGDSLMMSLQSLTRNPTYDKEQIETELFVNHCPIGPNMVLGPTRHYKFTPVDPSATQIAVPSTQPATTQTSPN